MLSRDVLAIDPAVVAGRIERSLREQVFGTLRRRGVVVGLSGGVDSSVAAGLAARALGAHKVLGLLMPERDSSPDSLRLGRLAAEALGIDTLVEDMAPILSGAGCYARQDAAVRRLVPEYGPGWRCKITLPPLLAGDRLNVFQLTVGSPAGQTRAMRMTLQVHLELVAATNFKQRSRKMMEYYHADRLQYAVLGTPNRLEHDQGFFVKQGDGAADVKPLAHLYKTQVYQIAQHLGIPEEIRRRPPTTDTYSMAQTQDEFYFSLPYDQMDLCLYAHDHDVEENDVARTLGLTPEQVQRVFRDIDAKRRATRHQHLPPLLVEKVREV